MSIRARTTSDVARVVDGVMHELRNRVGAVRLAVNAVEGGNGAARSAMLETADRETLRISTEMRAIALLVRCLTDEELPEQVDVRAALRAASSLARRAGVTVRIRAAAPALVVARPDALQAGLEALLHLAADTGGEIVATVTTQDRDVVVVVGRADRAAVNAGSLLVRHLIEGVGGARIEKPGAIAMTLPGDAT